MKQGFVYFMSNKKNGVIYIGVTSELIQRDYQHKSGTIEGFTKKYNCKKLVYFECHDAIVTAIEQEKKLKNLPRAKKIEIIERQNPEWRDLSGELI